jgi:hypothetical protein
VGSGPSPSSKPQLARHQCHSRIGLDLSESGTSSSELGLIFQALMASSFRIDSVFIVDSF